MYYHTTIKTYGFDENIISHHLGVNIINIKEKSDIIETGAVLYGAVKLWED